MASKIADSTLINGVIAGERRALAKAITLIESIRPDHQQRAENLLKMLMARTKTQSIRLGISGAPGVGKSTFIEALGLWLVEQKKQVAVLAVDPSSSISGGSILGDKVRMAELSQSPKAFIRPSPSAGSLGGVANKTREAMLVCEAADFEVIIVETVGVGQSETMVAGMVDMFILLQQPNTGDDLQAIKKGIVELADLIVINKADIDPKATQLTHAKWKQALCLTHSFFKEDWQAQVLDVSALKRSGIEKFWDVVMDYYNKTNATDAWQNKRGQQALGWMWQCIDRDLISSFKQHQGVQQHLEQLAQQVQLGEISPSLAARRLLEISHS